MSNDALDGVLIAITIPVPKVVKLRKWRAERRKKMEHIFRNPEVLLEAAAPLAGRLSAQYCP